MSQVLDYSWARPGAAAIRSAGYVGVMRYLSHDPNKNLSGPERDELRAAGLAIGLVWEDGAQNALGGAPQGQADAAVALSQARALGFPDSLPIYFAVDWDTTEAQQAAINAYLNGCASVLGAPRVGVYGSFYVVERCAAASTAAYGWQTLAWSGGQISAHAVLYQNGQKVFGDGADVNDVRGPWGGWPASGTSPAPTPGPEPTDPAAHWWGVYVAGADQVVELSSPCHAPVFEAGGTWYRDVTPVQPAVVGEFAQWTLANRVNGTWYVMDETGGPQGTGAQGRLPVDQAWWTEDAHVDTTGCGGTTPPAVALASGGHWYALVTPMPPPSPAAPPAPPAPPAAPTPPPPAPAPTPPPAPDLATAGKALDAAEQAVKDARTALGL